MTLKGIWLRRVAENFVDADIEGRLDAIENRQPIEHEFNGKLHIFAMAFPTDWQIWCCLRPGEAYNKDRPERGWPALEATLAPFRTSVITCESCLYMWRMVVSRTKRGKMSTSFLWQWDET